MATDFPSTWKLMTIEESMSAIIDYRGKTPTKTTFGVPLITAKIVKNGRILPHEEYIAEDEYEEWMRRGLPEKGDIVITTEAPLGEIAQLSGERIALAQRLITLRGNRKILDNTYLKFAMQSSYVQDQLVARATGTTVLGIKQSELRRVELPIPPLAEQERIADILGTLDDKIELNRRTNETLEAMAKALFKSWFVDFDPVREKAAGRRPAGLDAATAKLFPASFEDSSLGPVPKGWKAVPLSEAIEVNPNRSLSKGKVAPYLEMANMPTTSARAVAWEDREFGSGMRFINGDTLVARITPCLENGKTAYVDFLAEGQVGWGSTEYIVLRSKPPLPTPYTYFLARSDEFRTHVIKNMTGTSGRQRAPAECLDAYLVIVPDAATATRFGEFADHCLRQMKNNNEESATLAATRDALLPKLLSGELLK